ncbi:hypothetical protein SCLCIDRAFT_23449 [Scleroderma citrinum Foug A]|uniref:Uncharacterized protein n=1 Tax=Scleroderma citrinum Foug A TaxID=1036808 RepID=A0A0C3AHM5_9AGAM|nr:hypothetical protein SCLCIDRAFT_23449 [Scleroderma citrinum Foug A]
MANQDHFAVHIRHISLRESIHPSGQSTAVLPSPKQQDFRELQWCFMLDPYATLAMTSSVFKNGRNILYSQNVRQLNGNTFVLTDATSKQPPGVVLCALNKTSTGWDAEWAYFKQASLPKDDANDPEYKGLANEKPL